MYITESVKGKSGEWSTEVSNLRKSREPRRAEAGCALLAFPSPCPPVRRLRHGLPLARSTVPPKRKYPTHRGTLDVDVVIVGGGITGAICAYLFADAGVRVALVESKLVGHGSTVASTALLMQEPDRDFGDLAERFGRAATREIWKSLARATRDLAKTIRALKTECRPVRVRLGVLHARSRQSKDASTRVRRTKSGRTAGALAVGGSAVSDDRHQSAGRDRDVGKRAGESAAQHVTDFSPRPLAGARAFSSARRCAA